MISAGASRVERAEVEAVLLRIVADAVGFAPEEIDPDAHFLEIGASSLALVDAFRAVHETFGVRPSVREVFDHHASLRSLGDYVLELIETQPAAARPAPVAERAPDDGAQERHSVPLSPAQRRVGFLARYSEGASAAYNEVAALRLRGSLDRQALESALSQAVARHEALRASLRLDQDVQEIRAALPLSLPVVEVTPDRAGAWLLEESDRRFDFGAPLFRASLLRLAADVHLLAVTSHELVADQQALMLLLGETATLYRGERGGRPALLPKPLQLSEYLEIAAGEQTTATHAEAAQHWREVFPDAVPTLELPADHPRPAVKDYRGGRLVVPLEAAVVEELERWASRRETSLFGAILAAWTLFLHRMSGQDDLVVGLFGRARHRLAQADRLVASTRNPVPLRSKLRADTGFREHARTVTRSLLTLFDYQDFPFSSLIELLELGRDQSRSPVFTAAFDREVFELPDFGELAVDLVTVPRNRSRYDLQLTLIEVGDDRQLVCDYSTELFDGATMRRWMVHFQHLLRAAVHRDQEPVDRLPLLDSEQRERLLVDWNRTAAPFPAERSLWSLFEEQAQRTPSRPALTCGEQSLTYAELEQAARDLGARLQAAGVEPGDRIGVCLDRSPRLVAALLACARAGCAYVPLDPDHPEERLRFMAEDAGLALLLTTGAQRVELASAVPMTIYLDSDRSSTSALAKPPGDSEAGLAYVMYTSGSTGRPKGVCVGERGLVNLLWCIGEQLGFTAADVMLAITTVGFDISTLEIFMPLIRGGRVDLATEDVVADGGRLAERLVTSAASFLQATPSTWRMLLEAGWEGDRRLTMISSGEALARSLAERLLQRGGVLWNLYGPTEATVYATGDRVAADPAGGPVAMGRPLANTRVYIVDRHFEPVPIGVPGELCLAGLQLARGYWRRPELTAERFPPSPFAAGERIYRTGDLARYRPTGEIECLGRLDHQVKVHGVRVELGEIESQLHRIEGVRQAVVVAGVEEGGAELAAYVAPEAGFEPSAGELRRQLRRHLPEVMVPRSFLFLEALPLTPNGKIDRGALPRPDSSRRLRPDDVELVAPRTPTETLLAAIWKRVLEVDRVGAVDDFFDLGGHSLLLTPLMVELRRVFSLSLSLRELFAVPRLDQLAEWIDRRRRETAREGAEAQRARQGARPLDPRVARERADFLQREAELPRDLLPAASASVEPRARPEVVLLTGATGFLGGYLVDQLIRQSDVQIRCLLRGKGGEPPIERLRASLRHYDLWREDGDWRSAFERRISVLPGDITRERLGLSARDWDATAQEADLLIHSAALVNFLYPYEALRPMNVWSLREVMRLAFARRITPLHFISTAAIWPMGAHRTFFETDSIDHGELLNLGYDEAKWVAEKMLANAAQHGLPVGVYRPGEVGGDSVTGRCVPEHFAVALFDGGVEAGAFPALDSFVDVTPVDYVARALVHLALHGSPLGRSFHLTNPRPWHAAEVFTWLRSIGYEFEELPFDAWRDRLVRDPAFHRNALYPYLALLEEFGENSLELPRYDTTQAEAALAGTGIECPAVDAKLLGTYVEYLTRAGVVPAAGALRS